MKITDTHVYFYTNEFSNWYPTKDIGPQFDDPLTGLTWNNTEEAFMYYKAIHFKDLITACKIINHSKNYRHPSEVKNFGRQVRNYNDAKWAEARYNYMVYVNYLKFSQDDDFWRKLVDTGDRILVEASPDDKIWGVGLEEVDPKILDEKNWKGLNLLGKALMEVRTIIQNG